MHRLRYECGFQSLAIGAKGNEFIRFLSKYTELEGIQKVRQDAAKGIDESMLCTFGAEFLF